MKTTSCFLLPLVSIMSVCAARVAANYPFRVGPIGTQNISLIAQHQENRNRNGINRAINANSVSPLLSTNTSSTSSATSTTRRPRCPI
jgi:hypothetical protein